jgi:hypothetical protein
MVFCVLSGGAITALAGVPVPTERDASVRAAQSAFIVATATVTMGAAVVRPAYCARCYWRAGMRVCR